MNPDTINYPIPHYPAMYYHYTSSLPPPSSDNIQYHHFYYYSIPPPPKFYVPTQSIQQQYYENYHRQRYLHQHRYYQHNYDHIPTRSPIPYKTRKSNSRKITARNKQYNPLKIILGKSSMTDNTKPMIMGTDTKTKPFPIKKSMKSAVKW
jgi:hypothetical protein